MDSRTFEDALPQELQLYLFSFLRPKEIGRMQSTSSYYQMLLNDNLFWKQKYIQDQGPISFSDDTKNQYIAGKFNWRVYYPDLNQIRMQQLLRFLDKHPEKRWSFYFRGSCAYYGTGVRRNHDEGLNYLIKAYDVGDYQACFQLVQILLATKISDASSYQLLLERIGALRLKSLIDDLHCLHNKQQKQYSRLLGRVYAHGLSVEANFDIAESYFLSVLDDTPNALGHLANYKYESLPDHLSRIEKTTNVINYLLQLKATKQFKTIDDVICYHQAFLSLLQDNRTQAIDFLIKAKTYTYALAALGSLYREDGIDDKALECFLSVFHSGDTSVLDEIFELLILRHPLEETIHAILEIAPHNTMDIAIKVSAKFREDYSIDNLCQDSVGIWWLQLAAQSGCRDSLNALLSVDAKENPYVACALGIIYEYGIYNSDLISANHDKSKYYFYHAIKCDVTSIEIYTLMGIGYGLAKSEVVSLLQTQTNPSIRASL